MTTKQGVVKKVSVKKQFKVKIRPIGSKKDMEIIIKANPDVALKLEVLHHKYSGKQAHKEARKIRRSLRRIGIYLSHLGHFGPKHD